MLMFSRNNKLCSCVNLARKKALNTYYRHPIETVRSSAAVVQEYTRVHNQKIINITVHLLGTMNLYMISIKAIFQSADEIFPFGPLRWTE